MNKMTSKAVGRAEDARCKQAGFANLLDSWPWAIGGRQGRQGPPPMATTDWHLRSANLTQGRRVLLIGFCAGALKDRRISDASDVHPPALLTQMGEVGGVNLA